MASELLRTWRVHMELSQGAAAEKLGVTQATWSDYEAGNKIPRVDKAFEIERLTKGEVPARAWIEPARIAELARKEKRERNARSDANLRSPRKPKSKRPKPHRAA